MALYGRYFIQPNDDYKKTHATTQQLKLWLVDQYVVAYNDKRLHDILFPCLKMYITCFTFILSSSKLDFPLRNDRSDVVASRYYCQ